MGFKVGLFFDLGRDVERSVDYVTSYVSQGYSIKPGVCSIAIRRTQKRERLLLREDRSRLSFKVPRSLLLILFGEYNNDAVE